MGYQGYRILEVRRLKGKASSMWNARCTRGLEGLELYALYCIASI